MQEERPNVRAASAPDISASVSHVTLQEKTLSTVPESGSVPVPPPSTRRQSLPEGERRASLALINPQEAAQEKSQRQRPSILPDRKNSPARLSTSAPDLRSQADAILSSPTSTDSTTAGSASLESGDLSTSKKKRFTLKGLFSRNTDDTEVKKEKEKEAKEKEKEKDKEKEKEKEKDKDKDKEKEHSPIASPKPDDPLSSRSASPPRPFSPPVPLPTSNLPTAPSPTITSPSSSTAVSDAPRNSFSRTEKSSSRAISPFREKDSSVIPRALSPERSRDSAAGATGSPGASLKSLWDRIRRRGSSSSVDKSLLSPPSEPVDEALPGEYEPLNAVLLHSPHYFIAYVTGISVPVTEVDSVASALCMFFDVNGLLMPFLKAVIEFEISQSQDVTTLFRSTTFAAVLLASVCKRIAAPYVTRIVKPFVEHLRSHAPTSLELNPTQTRDAASIPESAMQLADLTANLHDAVTNSLSTVPMPLRIICHLLYEAVSVKNPEHAASIVAGMFFLRVICPPILTPEGLGITTAFTPDQRRTLVLVSKIMQQIANGEPYPSESYMAVMNQFVATRAPLLKTFLEKLSKPPIEADKQLAMGSLFLDTDSDRDFVLRSTQGALFQLAATYTARIEESVEQFAAAAKLEYDSKKGVAEAVNQIIETRKSRKKK